MQPYKQSNRFWLILHLTLVFLFCTKTREADHGKTAAKVGSKLITTKDMMYRAELTPLPPRINTPEAVLNNLIAEKLLVFEAGDTSSLSVNPNFQAHIRGIKEQAMRDALYNAVIEENVQLNEQEVRTAAHTSVREYTVSFYNVYDRETTEAIFEEVEENPDAICDIYEDISGSHEVSHKTITWDETGDPRLFRSLYVNRAEAGDVLAPIRISPSQSLIMRVEDYKIKPVLGPEEQQIRRMDVRKEFHRLESMVAWKAYTSTFTDGKEIRFERDAFGRIIDMLMPAHTSDAGLIKREQLDQATETVFNERAAELDAMLDNPFFTFDGRVWTVGDFKAEIASHPLMYSKKEITPEEFPNRFKEAVANLLLDHMLTEEAYDRSYDELPEVRREAETWHDALLSKYQLKKVLRARREAQPSDLPPGVHNMKILETYMAELRDKYDNEIQVFPQQLDSVKLTGIPFMGYRLRAPYPIAVPTFPLLTTADTLIFK